MNHSKNEPIGQPMIYGASGDVKAAALFRFELQLESVRRTGFGGLWNLPGQKVNARCRGYCQLLDVKLWFVLVVFVADTPVLFGDGGFPQIQMTHTEWNKANFLIHCK